MITLNQTIDFHALGFLVKTESYPMPAINLNSYSVIDRDGEITFSSGLRSKQIKVTLMHKESVSLSSRRYLFGLIKPALLEGGYLIFDYEPQIKWRAKVLNGADVKFSKTHDIISIDFTVSPYGENSFDEENATWEEAAVIWEAAGMSWAGSQNTFSVSNEIIVVENLGNYPSRPIIKITGTGNISLTLDGKTLTVTGLSGTIYIDCDKMIAYDDAKLNKMPLTNATFLVLKPISNTIAVTGTADLEFINKSRWV